jgi:hypothetical protein
MNFLTLPVLAHSDRILLGHPCRGQQVLAPIPPAARSLSGQKKVGLGIGGPILHECEETAPVRPAAIGTALRHSLGATRSKDLRASCAKSPGEPSNGGKKILPRNAWSAQVVPENRKSDVRLRI